MSPLISVMSIHTLWRQCREIKSFQLQTIFLEILNWDYFTNLILLLQIWSRSLKEYYEKCFCLNGADQKLLQWNCQGYTHNPGMLVSLWNHPNPPKHKLLFKQTFFGHSFWGSYGWDQMSPNTHIVPNKLILSGAFRQRVSLQRISSRTWKNESYHK